MQRIPRRKKVIRKFEIFLQNTMEATTNLFTIIIQSQ